MELKRFSANEIVIERMEAYRVLDFYFDEVGTSATDLSTEDIAFAQALLLEGIDASYKMGYAQILFESFFMKTPTNFQAVQSLVKKFAKKALSHWWKHARRGATEEPKIYESVRSTIRRNFRSIWSIRVQTGELTY